MRTMSLFGGSFFCAKIYPNLYLSIDIIYKFVYNRIVKREGVPEEVNIWNDIQTLITG